MWNGKRNDTHELTKQNQNHKLRNKHNCLGGGEVWEEGYLGV